MDNAPILQSKTCMLSDDEPVTVRTSKFVVCTCSCMFLMEAQIMMLVISHHTDIPMSLCDAVSQT